MLQDEERGCCFHVRMLFVVLPRSPAAGKGCLMQGLGQELGAEQSGSEALQHSRLKLKEVALGAEPSVNRRMESSAAADSAWGPGYRRASQRTTHGASG